MAVIVQKFGGSSVADVQKLEEVAEKVVAGKQAGDDVVVVVSAMGKTTDQLLALAREVDPSPPRRELDMLLSSGERISMALLSMAVQKRGVESISFTGSQSGIITNDRHFDAKIIDVRPHRVEDELARGRVVIVAGYQGMSYKREITTLGRGGSDTTALAMAAALGAARAEIYSDVDGVYSADPRSLSDAQHLPNLSYVEMQEMAVAGARVLHAPAVDFAKAAGIAIHARSTFQPGRETIVHGTEVEPGARAVVIRNGAVRVRLRGISGSEALRQLQHLALSPRGCAIDGDDFHFMLTMEETPDLAVARHDIERTLKATVHWQEGLSCVTCVGGLDEAIWVERVLDALADEEIVPTSVASGELRVSVWLDAQVAERAAAAIHRALVIGPALA